MFGFSFPLKYNEPLFRPPAEADSLIFQLTYGCSWNRCAFCEMYTSKQFKIRKEEELLAEFKKVSDYFPDTRRIFLADGNAMVLSANKLLSVLGAIHRYFPKASRISSYALPSDIAAKTDEELLMLRNHGLKTLYIGIESGDDELLKLHDKSETYESTLKGLLKAKKAGIKLSIMILNGLGGKKYSDQHAKNTAKLLNEVQPELLSSLVLSFPFGTDHFKSRFQGEFIAMSKLDLLTEMAQIINGLDLKNTIFRSDHASNYIVLNGVLNRDKQNMLSVLKNVIENPDKRKFRPEFLRGL